jgi:demethylmenaquinone methyltransferase/2-methoxy-6-polyprenyl-1,4-benzoquinol methylase
MPRTDIWNPLPETGGRSLSTHLPDTGEGPDTPPNAHEPSVDFGFLKLAPEEHRRRIETVFRSVANRYDLMNDLMSAGLHRLWKRAMIDWFNPQAGGHYLDAAGGTGDIARLIARKTAGKSDVIIADSNDDMLRAGRARSAPEMKGVIWLCASAERLPLPACSFDGYTIAFGIRNVTDIAAALQEAYRLLKPGGRFLCLEFSTVEVPGLDWLYERYSFHAIPQLGRWVTGDAEAYRYLVESIRRFPDQEDFAVMIAKAGFARVRYRNLSGGIVALHSAWRL